MNSSAARLFHDVKQFTLLTVTTPVFVVMYYSHPFRLAKTSLAKQSTSHCVVFDTQADFVGAIVHNAPLRMDCSNVQKSIDFTFAQRQLWSSS